jgi:hypothetical protein
VERELNKAYCGFLEDDAGKSTAALPLVSTGHWGCGAFGGTKELKSLLQLMAASLSRRDVPRPPPSSLLALILTQPTIMLFVVLSCLDLTCRCCTSRSGMKCSPGGLRTRMPSSCSRTPPYARHTYLLLALQFCPQSLTLTPLLSARRGVCLGAIKVGDVYEAIAEYAELMEDSQGSMDLFDFLAARFG